MNRRILALIAISSLVVMAITATAQASPWEREDIFGQGTAGPTVAADGAQILRTANGLSAKVAMPTPAPGSYTYPQGPTASGVSGHPEAFSLWVFIFFNPEACDGDCDGPDLQTNAAVVAGAFNAGGHLVGGPNLTISGHVNHQSAAFGGPNAETLQEALSAGYDLADAEIHLAVAPHGALDPALLPAQITTPAGDPSLWWLAIYK